MQANQRTRFRLQRVSSEKSWTANRAARECTQHDPENRSRRLYLCNLHRQDQLLSQPKTGDFCVRAASMSLSVCVWWQVLPDVPFPIAMPLRLIGRGHFRFIISNVTVGIYTPASTATAPTIHRILKEIHALTQELFRNLNQSRCRSKYRTRFASEVEVTVRILRV